MDIDISEKYTISEASEMIGFEKHVLRFYEKELEIEVPRNKSGHRYYTYSEIERFNYIKKLKERGLTIKQIKSIINSSESQVAVGNELVLPKDQLGTSETTLMDIKNTVSVIEDLLSQSILNFSDDIKSELRVAIRELNEERLNDDKDTLISENARLKMKLKERAYETAQLKDKLRKHEKSSGSILKKFFG